MKYALVGSVAVVSLLAGIGIAGLVGMGVGAGLGIGVVIAAGMAGFTWWVVTEAATGISMSRVKELAREMRETVRRAKSKELQEGFKEYLQNLWVSSDKLNAERALRMILEEFDDQAWLYAIYAELLMSDSRWSDAEVMIKKAWQLDPSNEYVREMVKQWIEARSEKDPFRVSEIVRKLREVKPEGWLFAVEAEHLMKIGRYGHIEEVLLEAYDKHDDATQVLEIVSSYLGYLASEKREQQMFQFFQKLQQRGEKPILKAIEIKLAILIDDLDRAVEGLHEIREMDIDQEIINMLTENIMEAAGQKNRQDIIEKVFS